MKSTKLFQFSASNVVTAIFLLLLTGFMAWLITGDISRMIAATTNYEYYKNAIYLIDNIARTYFFCIFMLMLFLTYINKQYSKWCVSLFYIAWVSTIAYYTFAIKLIITNMCLIMLRANTWIKPFPWRVLYLPGLCIG